VAGSQSRASNSCVESARQEPMPSVAGHRSRASNSSIDLLDNDVWRKTGNDKVRLDLYRRSCVEFLLLGPLFVVFMLLLYTHMSLPSVYAIERVLKSAFQNKRFGNGSYTVYDVHDAALFWEWLETMLEETVGIQEDQLGHQLPQAEWGYISSFNKITGGVRLLQDRGSRRPCEDERTRTCYGLDVDKAPFGYPPCGAGSGACYDPNLYRGMVDVEANEGFTVDNVTGHFELWLDTLEPLHVLKNQVQYLEDRHWIDQQTRQITIELLVQNYQFEPLFSLVLIRFRFDRAGYIEDDALVETVPGHPYFSGAILKICLSACYGILNLFFVAHLLHSWKVVYTKKGSAYLACRRLLLAKGVEIVNVLVALAQISLWSIYVSSVRLLSQRMDGLQRPSAVPLHNSSDAHVWDEYHHEIAYIEHIAESCIRLMRAIRVLAAVILSCFLARYFQVWKGIPAFAVVTKTLALSAHRVGAVLTTTGVLLVLFSGTAMLTYGAQLEEFHCVQCALQETAIIAMTGEPGLYSRMTAVDPLFSALWYWSLIAIVFMVVLNMVLGVLVDAAISAGSNTQITLSQQLYLTLSSPLRCLVPGRGGGKGALQRPPEPGSEPRAAELRHGESHWSRRVNFDLSLNPHLPSEGPQAGAADP